MGRRILLGVLLLLMVIYVGVGYFFSGVILFGGEHNEPKPIDTTIANEVPNWDVDVWERVRIQVEEGISVAGVYFENPEPAGCGVILLHGHTSEKTELLPYAPLYWNRGCDVLIYDARGHGESDPAALTFGYHEKEDASDVVDWLAAESQLAPNQIGLVGTSYGAATALQTLLVRDDLGFIIADSSYQDMETIILARGVVDYGAFVSIFNPIIKWLTNLRGEMVFDEVSPLNAVAGKSTPVLLLHSERDGFTFVFHSENIFANANPSSTELHITPWTDVHGARFHDNPGGYIAIIDGFLADKVPNIELSK